MSKTTRNLCIILTAAALLATTIALSNTTIVQDKNRLHIAIAYDNTGPHSINSYEYNFLESCVRKFEDKHPNATITLESVPITQYSDWLYQSILFGNIPDVFTVLPQDFPMFMEIGLLKPLPQAPYAEQISSSLLEFWSDGQGSLYALPYAASPPCLLVNNNLLEEDKERIDEYIFDWMDLYYYCATYTQDFDNDGVMDQIGISNMDWRTAVYANGQVLFDTGTAATNFDHPDVEYAIKFATSMNRLSLDDFDGAFEQQKALMKVASLAEARYYAENHPEIDLEIFPFPKGPDGKYTTEPYNSAFGIRQGSASFELAIQFMDFVMLDETQQLNLFVNSYSFPVLLSLQNSAPVKRNMEKHITDQNFEQLFYHSDSVPVDFIDYYALMDIADKEIFQYIQSNTDIAHELKMLNHRMEELFKASIDTSQNGKR